MKRKRHRRTYIVLGTKSWHRRMFRDVISRFPGTWHFLARKEDLTPVRLRRLRPRYLFFLHWSWKVPVSILEEFECVNFHMTDLPYGRGGSPLQNLILRGHRSTKLCAFRMTSKFDAGPVYTKVSLSLKGTAEEILMRATTLSTKVIRDLIHRDRKPTPQRGRVTVFRRRTPVENRIPPSLTLKELYDFIRMLDGEGYPAAFLETGGFRYEFHAARLYTDVLRAEVTVTPLPPSS